ncbi:MAG TPA: YidC/Oxa1 family membrane protein insertase [Acidimicrobiales bacterium]|nr:YidC/Oxa1 family membrane protein insertase [Acidimicrobiales bacterium]
MFLASTIGQIGHPFYEIFAWILATAYSLIPNYAVAIALLTIVVMLAMFPINVRGQRGMMKMQLLGPEMKKLQAKYKASPGLTVGEKQELRQRQQEEMMALYKEHNVSPTGGCLPMVLQMPVFLILYGTIRGLIHTVKGVPLPLYVAHTSRIYQAVRADHGHLNAFGVNLADSVRSGGLSFAQKLPFIALILVAIALQYIQMKQLSGRNAAAAAANPQMQQMQKIFPLIFAVIYISIPAGVNVYFIVSALFRIGQQELIYRRDPHIQSAVAQLRERGNGKPDQGRSNVVAPQAKSPGLLSRFTGMGQLTPAAEGGTAPSPSPRNATGGPRGRGGKPSPKTNPGPKAHPRAQGKRPRRAR